MQPYLTPLPPHPEYLGIMLHFLMVGWILSGFGSVMEALGYYAIGMVCVGVLSLQLLISHMTQPVSTKDEGKLEGNWARRQVGVVIDVIAPWWLEWCVE